LWQGTRDPACKTAVNLVTKLIRRKTSRKALERWETNINNSEVTPQAIWPIAKSLLKRVGPRAPTAIHGASGLKFHPLDKANAIADSLEIQFTPHDLCDNNHSLFKSDRLSANNKLTLHKALFRSVVTYASPAWNLRQTRI
jgi:hypothetical protein